MVGLMKKNKTIRAEDKYPYPSWTKWKNVFGILFVLFILLTSINPWFFIPAFIFGGFPFLFAVQTINQTDKERKAFEHGLLVAQSKTKMVKKNDGKTD